MDYDRTWRAAHPGTVRAYSAKYRATDPEKARANQARYRARHLEKEKARRAEWRAAHPERDIIRRFGLTAGQVAALRAAHAGLCQLCGGPETIVDPRSGKVRRLSVDHDHGHCKRCDGPTACSYAAVRGLLCSACNFKLARYEAGRRFTDPAWISAADAYLARFESGEVRVLLERVA
jgi:hypothetical protein